MAILQPIIDLVSLCAEQGITYAVISPGSRSAPLAMAFARNTAIETIVVMDERSAGFIALGIAQQLKKPVVLVCTSGSAGYNFAPAVVEAYFQQIPLVVLTADRPKEWIHQQDGQTIFQTDLYGKHTKKSFELLSNYSGKDVRWFINRTVNEAVLLTTQQPFGPVHINVPIEEPFYPTENERFDSSPAIRKVDRMATRATLSEDAWLDIVRVWNQHFRIVIAGGQQEGDEVLSTKLRLLATKHPVVGDVISNLGTFNSLITSHDCFLSDISVEELRPTLLVTFGKSFISKAFKEFVRKNKPEAHWHIGEDTNLVDTFQSLTRYIPVSPSDFFSGLVEYVDYQGTSSSKDNNDSQRFYHSWERLNRRSKVKLTCFLDDQHKLNDLTAFNFVLNAVSEPSQLHIANSMAIRYVNLLGCKGKKVDVFSNRGTSGIDGCVSTAIGASIVNGKQTYLLVGDVAFLYDRNGLLIKSLPKNLKIIIFNNQGGTIFRLIDGPARQPELNDFFETSHCFTAERTAADSEITYFAVNEMDELAGTWTQFDAVDNTAILEIFTNPVESAGVYKALKAYMKDAVQ